MLSWTQMQLCTDRTMSSRGKKWKVNRKEPTGFDQQCKTDGEINCQFEGSHLSKYEMDRKTISGGMGICGDCKASRKVYNVLEKMVGCSTYIKSSSRCVLAAAIILQLIKTAATHLKLMPTPIFWILQYFHFLPNLEFRPYGHMAKLDWSDQNQIVAKHKPQCSLEPKPPKRPDPETQKWICQSIFVFNAFIIHYRKEHLYSPLQQRRRQGWTSNTTAGLSTWLLRSDLASFGMSKCSHFGFYGRQLLLREATEKKTFLFGIKSLFESQIYGMGGGSTSLGLCPK